MSAVWYTLATGSGGTFVFTPVTTVYYGLTVSSGSFSFAPINQVPVSGGLG